MAEIDQNTSALIEKNRYVGEVIANILDQYDNPTYNLRLYFNANLNPSDDPRRSDEASPNDDRADQSTAPPTQSITGDDDIDDDIVVLAQTGVTGATIDTVQIQHIRGSTSSTPSLISFTVTEPGGVSLMDQMIAAKRKLGLGAGDTVLYLDILFRGYETDNEASGKHAIIAGPFTYRIGNLRYGLSVNESGSVYNFNGYISEDMGYLDEYYRVPESIETTGTTMQEHITKYTMAFNAAKAARSNDFIHPDEIVIDTSGLLKGQGAEGVNSALVVEDILLTDLTTSESINRVFNEESNNRYGSAVEYIESQREVVNGRTVDLPATVKVIMKTGSTIEDFIATLLSMNDDFFKKATRMTNPGDATSASVDQGKTFVHWFRINADLEYLKYDLQRGAYTKKIYFKPIIYKEGRASIGVIRQEHEPLTEEQVNSRVRNLGIYKAYEYMFTGRNDQILNFDININEGWALEVALPDWGNFSASSGQALAPTLNPNDENDSTSQGLAQQAATAKNKFAVLGLLNRLQSQDEDNYKSIVSNFGSLVGLSREQIVDVQNNVNGATARALKNVLANQQVASTLADLELRQRVSTNQFGVLTESDDPNVTTALGGLSTYKPEASGFVFAPELVNGLESVISQEESDALRAVQGAVGSGSENFRATITPVESSHRFDAATYERNTMRNTAFSHLMSQHNVMAVSLLNLEFEIRGDPWYLGLDTIAVPTLPAGQDTRETDEFGAIWDKGTNHIMFSIAAPKRYDFDVQEEDNNSGLYDFGGLNFMLSGIYTVIHCTSSFAGGMFTQHLKALKNNMLPSNLINPVLIVDGGVSGDSGDSGNSA